MKIILRVLAVIVFFIIAIIIAGFIAGHFLINSANIKKMLIQKFHQYTGHTLAIKDLSFSVFPTTQLEIKGATISNAQGFGSKPLASLKEVDAGVKILPLFSHKLVTTGLTVEGLHLNLEVNKKGQENWAGLTDVGQAASQPMKQNQQQITHQQTNQHKSTSSNSNSSNQQLSLTVPKVDLQDITIVYNNQHTGETLSLNKVNLLATNITNDAYFPFKLSINYQTNKPKTAVDVSSQGHALFAPNQNLIKLKDVSFNSNVTKNNTPMRFRFSNLATTIKFPNNGIIVKPLTANLYNGKFSGQAKVSSGNKTVNIATSGKLSAVNLTALLKDLTNQDKFSGQGNISYNLKTHGTKSPEFISNLNGKGAVQLTKVQFKGFDLGYEYRNGLNLLQHGKQLNKPHGNVTKFGHINGNYTISDGVVNLRKLNLTSPVLVIEANGLINLNNQKLKLRIATTGMQGSLGNLRPYGPTIPFDVKGTFNHPQFVPDLGALAKAYLQEQAKNQVQKALKKLGKDNKGKLNLNDLGKLFGH